MYNLLILGFCVLISTPLTLQHSYIKFVKHVDTSVSPEQHFIDFLHMVQLQNVDIAGIELSKAFYIGTSVYFILDISDSALYWLDESGIKASFEKNIEIHLASLQVQNTDCESSNVTEELWHIGRIRRRDKIEVGINHPYFLSNNTDTVEGNGTDVYIFDTGIRKSHSSFAGRVTWGYVAPVSWDTDKTEDDLNGHGTHVAGIVGADNYGIARDANIISVKVLSRNGGSALSDLLDGIAFALGHALNKSEQAGSLIKAICNLSLSFVGSSESLENAIQEASSYGLIFVVAAGNDDSGSCYYSPGRIDQTITVAASDIHDVFYFNSNYGSCVDVIAPGVDILSAGITSDTSTDTMTGTSMATPMVAGALSVYMSRYTGSENITHQMVMEWLTDTGIQDAIDIPPNIAVTTVNLLLFITCTSEEEGNCMST